MNRVRRAPPAAALINAVRWLPVLEQQNKLMLDWQARIATGSPPAASELSELGEAPSRLRMQGWIGLYPGLKEALLENERLRTELAQLIQAG